MPRFMDFHPDLPLPEAMIEKISDEARAGVTDAHGVRQLELFHNDEGKVYCLLEAPDEEAVRAHHADLGAPCGDVHQVDGIF